jgi:hypothetical protein
MFIKLMQKSIKHKLITIIVASCITSVCLTTIAFMVCGIYHIKNQMKEDLNTMAQAVSDRNSAALAFEEFNLINIDLSLLAANSSIQLSCVYNNSGKVLAVYGGKSNDCPKQEDAGTYFASKSLITFHNIKKSNELIGRIFIRSDLKKLNNYIKGSLSIASIIILCLMLISYFMALKLQGVIHKPILNLMTDARTISEEGDYSARVRKLYEDELGSIVDTFNSILEKIDNKNKEFFQKSKELQVISKKSEIALEYFNKEFKNPFHAANSFRSLMKDQVFGPVNPTYIDYFNDLCSADVELYCIVNKVMELYKIQSEIYSNDNKKITAEDILSNITKKYLDDDSNIFFTSSIDLPESSTLKQMVELFVDNMVSTFFNSANEKDKYFIHVSIKKEEENNSETLRIKTEFKKAPAIKSHVNDNFNNIKLDSLIENIKNFEAVFDSDEEVIIDFNNMVVRGKINMLNFLSSLNSSYVVASVSPNAIAFTLVFKWEEAVYNSTVKELA